MNLRLTPTGWAVVALTAGALLVGLPFVPDPVRTLTATAFFLVGPGLAWTHALPVNGPIERMAVSVALSLALDVLVAELLMFAGLPGLLPAALLLAAVALSGAAVEARKADVPKATGTRTAPT